MGKNEWDTTFDLKVIYNLIKTDMYMWWLHRGITAMKSMWHGGVIKEDLLEEVIFFQWFFFLVLLRNNWHISLCKFKVIFELRSEWWDPILVKIRLLKIHFGIHGDINETNNYQLTLSGLNHIWRHYPIQSPFLWD